MEGRRTPERIAGQEGNHHQNQEHQEEVHDEMDGQLHTERDETLLDNGSSTFVTEKQVESQIEEGIEELEMSSEEGGTGNEEEEIVEENENEGDYLNQPPQDQEPQDQTEQREDGAQQGQGPRGRRGRKRRKGKRKQEQGKDEQVEDQKMERRPHDQLEQLPDLRWSLPLFLLLLTPLFMSLFLAAAPNLVDSDVGQPDDVFLPFVGRPMGNVQACMTMDSWKKCAQCLVYDAKRLLGWLHGRRPKRVAPSIRATCITSCSGRSDGFYQSCLSCDTRALCYYGYFHDNIPCSGYKAPGRRPTRPRYWDDYEKRCVPASTTCDDRERCVSSCEDVPDGSYQSCTGCGVYATCRRGRLRDGVPCPPGQGWNDVNKTCGNEWTTCP